MGFDYSNGKNPHSFYTPYGMKISSNQTLEETVSYTKNSNNVMSVTVRTKNSDGTYDYSHGKIYSKVYTNVTNNVDTGKLITFNGYNYYPQQFPNGTWKITGVVVTGSEEYASFGPFKIQTNASVKVDIYNKDGSLIIGSVLDTGYLIHMGIYSTTWGCIKMGSDEDLKELALSTAFILNNGGKATINVTDAK